jgi:hypothetical protein
MKDELSEDLKSLESAGSRTRTVVGIIVTACVLGMIGLVNSSLYGWIAQRARAVARDNKYVATRLGFIDDFNDPLPRKLNAEDPDWPKQHLSEFSKNLAVEYAQTGFQNKMPLSGAVVDVYDFGLVWGVGFSALLLLLFYSLNTETTALRLAFAAAARAGDDELKKFYSILAPRQVLSIPKTRAVSDSTTPKRWMPLDTHPSFKWLRRLSKSFFVLPACVYGMIIFNDLLTLRYGFYISSLHTIFLIIYSIVFIFLLLFLIKKCIERIDTTNDIWDYWHAKIMKAEVWHFTWSNGESTNSLAGAKSFVKNHQSLAQGHVSQGHFREWYWIRIPNAGTASDLSSAIDRIIGSIEKAEVRRFTWANGESTNSLEEAKRFVKKHRALAQVHIAQGHFREWYWISIPNAGTTDDLRSAIDKLIG